MFKCIRGLDRSLTSTLPSSVGRSSFPSAQACFLPWGGQALQNLHWTGQVSSLPSQSRSGPPALGGAHGRPRCWGGSALHEAGRGTRPGAQKPLSAETQPTFGFPRPPGRPAPTRQRMRAGCASSRRGRSQLRQLLLLRVRLVNAAPGHRGRGGLCTQTMRLRPMRSSWSLDC